MAAVLIVGVCFVFLCLGCGGWLAGVVWVIVVGVGWVFWGDFVWSVLGCLCCGFLLVCFWFRLADSFLLSYLCVIGLGVVVGGLFVSFSFVLLCFWFLVAWGVLVLFFFFFCRFF